MVLMLFSFFLLAWQLAPLNCVGHDASMSAHFPGLCDRREALWTVSGSRRIRVMIWVVFRLISTAFPVQTPPHLSSQRFDLRAR